MVRLLGNEKRASIINFSTITISASLFTTHKYFYINTNIVSDTSSIYFIVLLEKNKTKKLKSHAKKNYQIELLISIEINCNYSQLKC